MLRKFFIKLHTRIGVWFDVSKRGLLNSTKTVAGIIGLAGTLTIITGCVAAVYYSFHARRIRIYEGNSHHRGLKRYR
jgi:hypothetical protein